MNAQACDKEQAVITALQSGNVSGDLLLHIESCRVCREVLMTAEALRYESACLDKTLSPPDAGVILRRAQQRARQEALARATLPIRIALACTLVVTILSAPWLFAYLVRLSWGFPFLRSPWLNGNWLNALSGTTAMGMVATLLCIGLSSWFVFREE